MTKRIRGKGFINFLWLGSSTLVSVLVNFGITVLLARNLGAEQFGKLSLIFAAASWIAVLRTALGSDLLRNSAGERDYAKRIFLPSILPLCIASSAVGGLGIALIMKLTQSTILLIPNIIIVLSFLVLGTAVIPASIYAGQDRMEWQHWTSANSLAIYLGLLIFSGKHLTILNVSIVYLVSALLTAIPVLLAGVHYLQPVRIWWSYVWIRHSWTDVAHLVVANLLLGLHWTIELYFLQAMVNAKTVGLFNAGQKLVVVLRLMPQIMYMSIVPKMARRLAALDLAYAREIWGDFSKHLLIIAGIVFFCFYVCSTHIIDKLFSIEYAMAAQILEVLSFSLIPLFLHSVIQSLLYAGGRYRELNIALLLGLVIQMIADFVLISKMGAAGAAVAYVFSELVLLVLLTRAGVSLFGLPRIYPTAKIAACWFVALCACLVGKRLDIGAPVLLSLVLIVFIATVFMIGELKADIIACRLWLKSTIQYQRDGT